jgi:hypothetical protein
MLHLAFEYLPAVSGIFLGFLGLDATRFRFGQSIAAPICVGMVCALVAGELAGGMNSALRSIALDSAAAICGNAAFCLIMKVVIRRERL